MRVGREFQAAVALRDDHAEEAMLLDQVPGLLRDVLLGMGDRPFVEQAAQVFDRPVEKRLFVGAERGCRIAAQAVEVRLTGEQFTFPPHRAGIERDAFGWRDVRQYAPEERQRRARDAVGGAVHMG